MSKEKVWDYMFHTTDRNFSGMGVVKATTEAEARKLVAQDVKVRRPDVEVRLIRIEPTTLSKTESERLGL